jgi:hypothetical protein
MKASEYISMLQALVDEHGDLEVEDANGDPMADPEEVEGVFVLADKG